MKHDDIIRDHVFTAVGVANATLQAIGRPCGLAVIGNSNPLRISCNSENIPVLCAVKDEIMNHLYFAGVGVFETLRYEQCDDGAFFEIW